MADAAVALAAASALHAGFQIVVTAVVYPAFAEVPEPDWVRHHAAEGRRIVGPVAIVYAAVLGAVAWAVVDGPSTAGWVAVGANAVAVLLTATVAAPAHLRLAKARTPAVLRRLRLADAGRTGAALVAAVSAYVAAL